MCGKGLYGRVHGKCMCGRGVCMAGVLMHGWGGGSCMVGGQCAWQGDVWHRCVWWGHAW